jgi:hypothetical protein
VCLNFAQPPKRLQQNYILEPLGCDAVGPIISSAMVAAIGNGAVFSKGRDFGAWLGLVPPNLDRRPHDPRQDIEAGQSLPARPVCPGGLGRASEAEELTTLRTQTLDRSGQAAIAPQRAGDRACHGPHRLGGSQQGAQLRRQDT